VTKKPSSWSRLDNAAKIFPSTSGKRDSKVFRFSCELFEAVDPPLLQHALTSTLQLFPGFQCILRRGLFWYYLESSAIEAQVKQEWEPPCSPIYDKNVKGLLFEVTYYKNRINLEIYHALTDGTGALQFLRMLVYQYLLLRHADELHACPLLDYDASLGQKMDDSFRKYYQATRQKDHNRLKPAPAYRIRGPRVAEHRIQVIEGVAPVSAILKKSKEFGVTVTVLLSSLLMSAISGDMTVRDKRRPVVLSIPVNLRNYFHSETARNFFGLIRVPYNFGVNPASLKDILQSNARTFKEELTTERLGARLNMLSSIEHNAFARVTPLIIKDVCLRIAYDLSAREETAALSNIGRVSMPKELTPYIRLFDVFVSTDKVQICMCSFEDRMTISFTSAFLHTDIQRRFFRSLTGMGIPVEIVSNQINESLEATV
jgi:NRPS condensation-like uncharacterized protein